MTRQFFTLVLCLSLGTLGTAASAANRTPTSIKATCIQPYRFHLSERGSEMKISMERNGYTTRIHEELSAGLNPTVTLYDFYHVGAGELAEGNGVFFIASAGDGATGFAAEVRERTVMGLDETVLAYNQYVAAGEWSSSLI